MYYEFGKARNATREIIKIQNRLTPIREVAENNTPNYICVWIYEIIHD